MDILWSAKKPLSARVVTDQLTGQKTISFNAVSTVLNRLLEKNMLVKHAVGKRYSFAPAMTKREYSQSILRRWIELTAL